MPLPNKGAHTKGGFLSGGQDAKEGTSDDLDWVNDMAANHVSTLDVTAGGTFDLSTPQANLDQYLESGLIQVVGTPGAATAITVPDGDNKIAFANVSGQTVTIDTVTGATPAVTLPDGVVKTLHVDGIEIVITADDSEQTGALLADGSVVATGDFNWAGKQIVRAELKDYSETSSSPSSVAGAITLDLEDGNSFEVTLTEDTTFTFRIPPVSGKMGSFTLLLSQDGIGDWVTIWPGTVDWPGGGSPGLTLTAGATDLVSFLTVDAGAAWFGFLGGLDFS